MLYLPIIASKTLSDRKFKKIEKTLRQSGRNNVLDVSNKHFMLLMEYKVEEFWAGPFSRPEFFNRNRLLYFIPTVRWAIDFSESVIEFGFLLSEVSSNGFDSSETQGFEADELTAMDLLKIAQEKKLVVEEIIFKKDDVFIKINFDGTIRVDLNEVTDVENFFEKLAEKVRK